MKSFRDISFLLCALSSVPTASGNAVSQIAYYAYGLPVYKSEVGDPDRYLYGGKEFESLKGINLYDFHARTYAPDISRFMQPDPLATENHGVSPYIFCNGDPINFVDPTGEKVYYVDMAGRLVTSDEILGKIANRSEYEASLEGLDRVVIIDQDGKIIRESDTFKEGTIAHHDNNQSELKGKDITLMEINDKKAARTVFEMLSKSITGNNSIEFGINIMDEGAFNDIFTGHKPHRLVGFNDVFLMRLEQGHTFTDIDHSHTNNAMTSYADEKSAKWVYNRLKLKGNQKTMPTMSIFESWGGSYYPYYSPAIFEKKKQNKRRRK